MFNFENLEVYDIVNIAGFILGALFGIIAQKNQFCFSGSIKDYILTNSTKRAASVVMAIIVAVIATYIVANINEIDLTQSNYYKNDINYFSIILGGALFGIGMMIADGCSSRHLVKFAQGDPYSLVTILFIAIFAYATTKGFVSEYITLITKNQTLLDISSYLSNEQLNIFVVLVPLFVYLWILTKSFKRILTLKDGFLVGIIIALGWYVTGVIGFESMEKEIALSSMSFVYPTAQTLEFFIYYQVFDLSFGISIILGVLTGAFGMSKFNKKYSFGCTASLPHSKIKYNMIGGALMGVGGVLAIGCTIGEGLSGVSSLATASIIAILSIMISGYLTARYLGRRDSLPMCFIFEWNDKQEEEAKRNFQI
ncbi:MAG: putative membrane protein YedE/YeeE [Arcobacteraceae bacterium]|jgi:uncharacterized membrane protein YedE/YeeE